MQRATRKDGRPSRRKNKGRIESAVLRIGTMRVAFAITGVITVTIFCFIVAIRLVHFDHLDHLALKGAQDQANREVPLKLLAPKAAVPKPTEAVTAAPVATTTAATTVDAASAILAGLPSLPPGLQWCALSAGKLPSSTPPLPCRLPPAQTKAQVCGACTASVHGLLPTTREEEAEETDSLCHWMEYQGSFLHELVGSETTEFPNPEEAKKRCYTYGNLCRGVTCNANNAACTMRSHATLHHSTDNEITHIKVCSSGNEVPNVADCAAATQGAKKLDVDGAASSEAIEHLDGAAIVVLAHNRKDDLKRCLQSLLRLKDISLFRLHVSIDDPSNFEAMENAVKQEATAFDTAIDVWRIEPESSIQQQGSTKASEWSRTSNTGKIAWHYYQAFEKVFTSHKYEFSIFLEEDLVVSPDFLALFRSTAWLLVKDKSLWSVSAWNDNGFAPLSSDSCQLQRTTYFPGLGFLLQQSTWQILREWWPHAPAMGWDYWMRIAFQRAGKESLIPTMPRTHHVSKVGSSVTGKAVKLFEMMDFAQVFNHCGSTKEVCRQFGDLSYLLPKRYEDQLREVVAAAPRVAVTEFSTASLEEGKIYVMPFRREEYQSLETALGHRPAHHGNLLLGDVRSTYLGVTRGYLQRTRSWILAVDRRANPSLLTEAERVSPHPKLQSVAAKQNQSCDDACANKGQRCDDNQMHFVNNCNEMLKMFPCEQGCSHQVGKDLPAYVASRAEVGFQQCLVTLISPMTCAGMHANTVRLCACVP